MILHNRQAIPPQVEPLAPTGTGSPPDSVRVPAHRDQGSNAYSAAQGDSRNQVKHPNTSPFH
jgi:hypothetical protein